MSFTVELGDRKVVLVSAPRILHQPASVNNFLGVGWGSYRERTPPCFFRAFQNEAVAARRGEEDGGEGVQLQTLVDVRNNAVLAAACFQLVPVGPLLFF